MGLDKVIRLDKGDFCGKAALAADGADPPNRFVTLVVDGDVPEYGAAVTKDGEQVGTLTSPCESPTLGKVIGLAVLRSRPRPRGRARRGRGRRRRGSGDGRADSRSTTRRRRDRGRDQATPRR